MKVITPLFSKAFQFSIYLAASCSACPKTHNKPKTQ